MKKIFRLSAIVAMLSMMATASVATSCSDDDDDDTTDNGGKEVVVYTKTFTGTVGGSSSSEGSFISVQEGKIYKTADLTEDNKVEIVFDGDKFFSASESKNSLVAENGCAAVITTVTKGKEYSFTTNGGENGKSYSGIIEVVEGTIGGASATVKIEVSAK